jgi:hypothetical protein
MGQGEPETVSGPKPAYTLPQHEPGPPQQADEVTGQRQQTAAHIRTLQAQLQQFQAQNATLLEREQIYQQRLQEANRLLQASARVDPRGLPPASEARYITDAEKAAATRVTKRKRARHHDEGEEDDD